MYSRAAWGRLRVAADLSLFSASIYPSMQGGSDDKSVFLAVVGSLCAFGHILREMPCCHCWVAARSGRNDVLTMSLALRDSFSIIGAYFQTGFIGLLQSLV